MRGIILGADHERLVIEATATEVAAFAAGGPVAVNGVSEQQRSDDFYLGRMYEREIADGYRGSRHEREHQELRGLQLEATLKQYYRHQMEYRSYEQPARAFCRLIATSGCEDVEIVQWPPPREIRRSSYASNAQTLFAVKTPEFYARVFTFDLHRQVGPITFEYRER